MEDVSHHNSSYLAYNPLMFDNVFVIAVSITHNTTVAFSAITIPRANVNDVYSILTPN